MSKKYEWAKDYIKRYEAIIEANGTAGNIALSGVQTELYELAKAIVDDVHGEMP